MTKKAGIRTTAITAACRTSEVFEGYNPEKHPTIYRTTNALVFPLKLIDDEEVLRGDDLSGEIQD